MATQVKRPASKPAPTLSEKEKANLAHAASIQDSKVIPGKALAEMEAGTAVKSVAVPSAGLLPALTGASDEVMARMAEVKDNLESVESFRIPRAKMTASGLELIDGETPILEVEGVIIHTKKTNVYYANPYNPAEVLPPTCFSPDGVIPSDGVGMEGYEKQHDTCKGCPQAQFGTNQMKSGKACRNLKPLYLLLSDEAIMPRQLTVTPASLKAANEYLVGLTERGISYRKVRTKISLYKENPKDTYYKMRFSIGSRLDEQRQKDIEFLRNSWLPIMNAQGVDASEIATEQGGSAQPVGDASGEY